MRGLRTRGAGRQRHGFDSAEHTFFEVVMSGASALIGKTLKETGFRSRYQAAVLAIHRAGERVERQARRSAAEGGRHAPARGGPRSSASAGGTAASSCWSLTWAGGPGASRREECARALSPSPSCWSPARGCCRSSRPSLLGAVVLVLTGVLTPWEARARGGAEHVLVVIAASFGIGAAIEQSGLAAILGAAIVSDIGVWGPVAALLAVTLATMRADGADHQQRRGGARSFPMRSPPPHSLNLDPPPFRHRDRRRRLRVAS